MTEDLSAAIRLGITIVLLSALVATVTSLFVVALTLLNGFTDKLSNAGIKISESTLTSIEKYPSVDGAMAYKVIKGNIGTVKSIRIMYRDGTETDDIETLLKKAEIGVEVECRVASENLYDVVVVEVAR